jgi:hypothetical protein
MNNWCIVGFHAYVKEMHGSRSKMKKQKKNQYGLINMFVLIRHTTGAFTADGH